MKKFLTAVVIIGVIVGGTWWLVHAATTKIDAILPDPQECTAKVNDLSATLQPEQASNAAVIVAIGLERGLPARAATIAIATAMQESKLYNLASGDRDSLGLFQQRPSQGWGTEEQILDPAYSTNKFFDELVKIHGYQDMVITEAAQKVQRSAYPEAYGDHEDESRALASALTGYSPGAFTCRIDEPKAGDGKPLKLRKEINQRLGGLVLRASAQDRTVTIPVKAGPTGHRNGWAAADYVVARAHELGIKSVAYDGRTWTAGDDRNWETTPEASAGRVVVRLA